MIDFHNHVLPNVDDGPKTLDESILMIKEAANQGITDIIQTVHFQHPKMEGKDTSYEFLKSEISKFQNEINKLNIKIKMHLSAEVFYLPNLLDISKNQLVTIGNGKYMLIEFSTNIFPTNYEREFFKLQLSGVTPIIAHPERYRFVINNKNIVNDWIEKEYVIQIDAGSILGQFGAKTQKFVMELINSGYCHIIGSDAHNSKKRNFCLADAYNYLLNNISNDYVNILFYNYLLNNISNDYVNILKNNSVMLLEGKKLALPNPELYKKTEKRNFFTKLYYKITGKR